MMLTVRKRQAVSILNAYKAPNDKVYNSQYVWVYDPRFCLRCYRYYRLPTLSLYKKLILL